METKGTDPHIYSTILPKYNPDSLYYISFDYWAPKGLDNLQIYFGPSYSENRCLKIGRLAPSNSYKNIRINILEYNGFWTQYFSQLRFDFGNTGDQKISVKNIQLTKPFSTELDKNALAKQRNLRNYINANFSSKVSAVTANQNEIVITGVAKEPNSFLCEISMIADIEMVMSNLLSVTPIISNNGNFSFRKERQLGGMLPYDRLYSRWAVGTKEKSGNYRLQSFAQYADNIDSIALQYLPEEKPASKKGLAGFLAAGNTTPDLDELGISNTTINIILTNLVSLQPTALKYQLNGQPFYFKPDAVEYLDKTVKACTDRNIMVSAILLVPRNNTAALNKLFVHPQSNSGIYSMANLTSLEGLNYYRAVANFLGQRYSQLDKKFGRIHHWIIHNEVDNGYDWTNAGDLKIENYAELYDRSARTIYYTMRQYNPAAKVFLSLTHFWNGASKGRYFPPHQFLNIFNDLSDKQGDYEWGVAYHPYPENTFDPKTWNDPDVTQDINTSEYITPKNIELIDEWMRIKTHLYKGGKVRTLLFSEQGIHSPSYQTDDLQMQAAGIAYMWKKFTRLPSLEAFHYHRIVDVRSEGGLMLGLKTAKPGTDSEPDKKKPSWFIYEKAGTKGEEKAFEFALPLIGIKNWSDSYNTLRGETMPYTISFSIEQQRKPVNDVSIYFNGEVHKTINGSAVFFNVASNNNQNKYTIMRDVKVIKDGFLSSIDKNISVNISL